jgi:hypothetical protein
MPPTTAFIDGVTLSQASWANDVDTVTYNILGAVSGQNTITGTGPTNYSYSATNGPLKFTPVSTNTVSTTLNVSPVGGAALGAKNVLWNNAACAGGELRAGIPCMVLYDGSAFHIVGNGFNAPFLDTHAIVEGSADSTKKVRIEADGITTGTTRVLTVRDADFDLGAATQAEQETGTILTASVTPGRQQFHPSAAKGWVYCDAGTGISASYNVTSVTDEATGFTTVNWATDFSSVNYCAIPGYAAASPLTVRISAQAAGTTQINTTSLAPANADPTSFYCAAFGDQ